MQIVQDDLSYNENHLRNQVSYEGFTTTPLPNNSEHFNPKIHAFKLVFTLRVDKGGALKGPSNLILLNDF